MTAADEPQVQWDPQVYDQFERERAQAFLDLVSRVHITAPARVVDLGCGTGSTTALLARRWPQADVLGIDASPAMLGKARAMPDLPSNLHFEQMDITDWIPSPGVDLVVSNAALQWVPHSFELIPQWCAALGTGAWLAIQVPHSAQLPSHVMLNRLVRSDRWREQLGEGIRAGGQVAQPSDYLEGLLAAGLDAQAWETEYLHLLKGPDPVLDWVRGTSLRPVIAALGADEAEIFVQQYSALLREAYPRSVFGTVYPFKRIFAVGRKR